MKLDIPVIQHSADVRLWLHVNGDTFKLAQLGPDFIILDPPQDIPPQTAEILMSVDGNESRWWVQLIRGASRSSPLTRIGASA